jgi:hypothetical protein
VLEEDLIDGEVLILLARSVGWLFRSGALARRLFICSKGDRATDICGGNLRTLQGFKFARTIIT